MITITIDIMPPSKNTLYPMHRAKRKIGGITRYEGYGGKKEYARDIMLLYPELRQFRDKIENEKDYIEYDVHISMHIPENMYKKFEPHNYSGTLIDAIFGEYRDNRVRSVYVEKVPIERGNNPYILLSISRKTDKNK